MNNPRYGAPPVWCCCIPGPTRPMGILGAKSAVGPRGIPGPTGSIGPTGPVGATGITGATGAAGATGATGATGTVVAPSRGFFQFSSATPVTIVGGNNIDFNTTSALLNISFTPPSSIILQNTGVYRLAYGVVYSSVAAGGSLLLVRVNGTNLNIGQLNISADTNGEVSTEVLVALNAGDVLLLGINGFSVTLTTVGIGAFLSIVQIE